MNRISPNLGIASVPGLPLTASAREQMPSSAGQQVSHYPFAPIAFTRSRPPQQEDKTKVRTPRPRIQTQSRNAYSIFVAEAEMKKARKAELDKLRSAPNDEGIAPDELPLAAYLLMRSAVGRRVEDTLRAQLRSANGSVAEARAALPLGRGNVAPDIEASNHLSSYMMDAAREGRKTWLAEAGRRGQSLSAKTFGQTSAAFARAAGAGNCGEYAHVSGHTHAAKLYGSGSSGAVHVVSCNVVDHMWAEWRVPRMVWAKTRPRVGGGATAGVRLGRVHDRIILDAWAYGPACLAEDSGFAGNPTQSSDDYFYTAEDGPSAGEAARQLGELASSHPNVQQFFNNVVAKHRHSNWRISDPYAPTPVLRREFVEEAVARIGTDMITEVQAVGVLRGLGEPVRQAAAKTGSVISEAKNYHRSMYPRRTE